MDTKGILQCEPVRIPDTVEQLLDEFDEGQQDLAAQAIQILGYTALQAAVDKTEAVKRVKMVLFQKLGIQPFTRESVAAYKKSKFLGKTRLIGPGTYSLIFCIGVLAFAISFWINSTNLFFGGFIAWICGLIGFVSVANEFDNLHDRSWHSVPINQYTPLIPEQALQMAIAIKQALPSAVIEIEALAKTDPFLVVGIEGERFYIAVWDEPDFKAEIR